MSSSVHFDPEQLALKKRILPIGMGFLSEELLQQVSDPAVIGEIDEAVSDFHKSIVSEARKARLETPFISKPAYILSPKHRHLTENELISLLADSETLFSPNYQQYGTDHNFFLGYAKMQGRSAEEQLAFCRERALKDVPEYLKGQAEQLLIKFQELMAAKKWTPQKAEDNFISEVITREISTKEIQRFAQWGRENLCAKLNRGESIFYSITAKAFPEMDVSPTESKFLGDNLFEFIQKQPDSFRNEYRAILAFYFSYPQAQKVLEQWLPDIRLRESDMLDLMSVLYLYLFHCKDISTVKKEKGHYRHTYRKNDEINYRLYAKKNEMLSNVVGRYKSWHEEDLDDVFFGLSEFSVDSSVSKLSKVEKPDNISTLYELTRAYLESAGYNVQKFSNEYAQCVIRSLYGTGNNRLSHEDRVKTFPFRYMMVCIAGTSRLFSSAGMIIGEDISAIIQKPYLTKPSIEKQRIQRIRFLNKLNRICCLNREDRSKNWKYFLQVHGVAIQSQQELNLWKEILYDGNANYTEEAHEDIPPVELVLLCTKFLSSCLPVQYQFLYCYEGGRYTHTGGFARFLREHPDGLQCCIQRIKTNNIKWKKPVEKYMKYWSGMVYDVTEIQHLCEKISGMIRWKSVPGASEGELQDFCREAHLHDSDAEEAIAAETANMRVLLVEATFHHILAENAENLLRKHIIEVFGGQQKFQNFKITMLP